jgi:HK97 gp10 family phage protein
MISMNANINGTQDIIEALKQLGQFVEEKLNDVTKVEADNLVVLLKNRIATNDNVLTGTLKNSITVYPSKKNPTYMWVGADYRRSKNIQGIGGGYAAHLVEFGTVDRYVGVKSKYVAKALSKAGVRKGYRGKMPVKPFMRPVYDENKAKVLQNLEKGYWKKIEEEAIKQGFKTK